MNKKPFIITILIFLLLLTGCPTSSVGTVNNFDFKADSTGYATGAMNTAEIDEDYEPQYVEESKYDKETNSFDGRKITYYGNVGFETRDYGKTKGTIESLFKEHGVLISNSSEYDHDEYWYYSNYRRNGVRGKVINWEVRVPIEKFNDFMKALEGMDAHLSYKNITSEDKTDTYNDTEVSIRSLEVQQERLLELLAKAESISEILEIEDRLTHVRYQLETLTNSNAKIDYDVKYSRVNIELKEVEKYSSEEYGFFDRLWDTIGESWRNFLDKMEGLLFSIIYLIPFVIVVAVVIFVVNYFRVKNGKDKLSLKKVLSFVKSGSTLSTILKIAGIIIALLVILYILNSVIYW